MFQKNTDPPLINDDKLSKFSLKFTRKIVLFIVGVTILVCMVSATSLWAFSEIQTAVAARKHITLVRNHASDLFPALTAAEHSQRSYALTGNEDNLKPYLAVSDNIRGDLAALQTLTLITAAQKHLSTLLPLVDTKLTEMAKAIELRRNLNLTAATDMVKGNQNKQLMDAINAEILAYTEIEENALEQQEATLKLKLHQMLIIISAASLFTLFTVFLFAYLIYRETQQRLLKLANLETIVLLDTQEQTNRKLLQSNFTLQVSEQKLAVTLSSIADAVLATDAEGRVALLNTVAEQLTGWTQTEAIGLPVEEIFHLINKETRLPVALPIKAALLKGTIQGLVNHTILIKRDGSECAIADSCAPIFGTGTQVLGAVLVFRDVTGEYAVQQALRDNTTLIQTILNTVGDGIITFHASTGRIKTVNPATERLFGYTAQELIGQNVSLLLPDVDQSQFQRCFEPDNTDDQVNAIGHELESVGSRKVGSTFSLDITINGMWLDGQPYFTGILRDITLSKKLAEESRRFFAVSQEPLCVVGFDGYFKSLNAAWEKALGYSLADLLSRPLALFIHPDDREATQNEISKHANDGETFFFENRYLTKEGSCRWFSWNVTPVTHEQLFYCSARDITEHKQNEAAQQLLFQRLQLALDAGRLGDWSWDAASDKVILGTTAAEIYGLPASTPLLREQMRELLSLEDADYARKAWDESLITNTSYNTEYCLIQTDSQPRWVAITGRGSYGPDGNVLGMHGVLQDISERKRVEEALQETDRRFHEMIDALPIAIYTTDAEGLLTYVNPAAVEFTGRSPKIGVDRWCVNWRVFLPDGTPVLHDQSPMAMAVTENRIIPGVEALAERPDGTIVSFMSYPTPLRNTKGKVIGGINMLLDITETRHIESKLHSAIITAERANRAKSDFLSNMSHELRTPLNAILGFAQLIEAGNPPPTDTQQIKLHEIIKAGWYLLDLINEILDLALIESGKLSLSPEPVLLSAVIRECQVMIEPQAQQHDIKLTVFPFDNSWVISSDQTRIKQILINLLSNAIKYNREPGKVDVTCTLQTQETIRISIKDTGPGLAPEKLAQLFQPFNRLGQEHSTKEGTGIGLVVTKRLVELMGGSIGVSSTIGVGSEFWIDLIRDMTPHIVADTPPLNETLVPRVAKHPMLRTLLYVEDNPANMLLVEQIIAERLHLKLLTATDAKRGIALARNFLPEIILMDINLPGINGLQALKILSEDPATSHIPVIALSANAMPLDIEKGQHAGFFSYLTKPIKIDEFINVVNDALILSETPLTNELVDQ